MQPTKEVKVIRPHHEWTTGYDVYDPAVSRMHPLSTHRTHALAEKHLPNGRCYIEPHQYCSDYFTKETTHADR